MTGTANVFRVAIAGSGPAALFCAEELLRLPARVEVTILERRSRPFGLVRYGVAPDHPNTRRVTKLFEQVLAKPGVELRTGITVGRDVAIDALRRDYDAVIIATGAEEDRTLGVPGADLPHVIPSTSFAGWLNGDPDASTLRLPLDHPLAVVIGNGNVALDVVRALGRPAADFEGTDIAPGALEALKASRIRQILVLGRRGPLETSFGETEIAEVASLLRCRAEWEGGSGSENAVAATLIGMTGQEPRCEFLFHRKVVSIGPSHRLVIDHNGKREEREAGLVVTAIGHRGESIEGLPFDAERGVIPTKDHRIVSGGTPIPGLYAAGWIKRGGKGLIGHNRRDAMETVKAIWADSRA